MRVWCVFVCVRVWARLCGGVGVGASLGACVWVRVLFMCRVCAYFSARVCVCG